MDELIFDNIEQELAGTPSDYILDKLEDVGILQIEEM